MAPMEITQTLHATERSEWRQWLMDNHATAREIWLVHDMSGGPRIPYIHTVEEALCFGWIDATIKKLDATRNAQRFSPRRRNSNWTELNKERCRRLIAQGLMTEAGLAVMPDLSPDAFVIPPDIHAALRADPQIWANFEAFPALYQRIRVSYIEGQRRVNADEFAKRLEKFLAFTRENKLFGRWEE